MFVVTLFRKDEDKNELDEDDDDKTQLNIWNGKVTVKVSFILHLGTNY